MKTVLLIALGGACGAVLRYGAQTLAAAAWPAGTLAVNGLGCLAIGAVWAACAGGPTFDATWRPFLVLGLLGAFTTFSAFAMDASELWQRGRPLAAAAYVGGSVFVSLAAVAAGYRLGGVVR